MPSYSPAEDSKSEPAKANTNVLELIFLFFITVLILASGICYLNLAPAMSERSDIQDEALGIYNQYGMIFDRLSKKYYVELVSTNKKIQSTGDN